MDERVFIPNTLDEDEIQYVIEEIDRIKKEKKDAENDYFLVDQLDGEINIKVLYHKAINDLAIEQKRSPKEIVMDIMRKQNEIGLDKIHDVIGRAKEGEIDMRL